MEDIIIGMSSLLWVALMLFFLWFFYIRLPRKMARKRGRNPFGWMIIFWLITPLWGAVLLLVAGDSTERALH